MQTKGSITATQRNLQYNTGVSQCNAAQHWWYGTILAAYTSLNTSNFAERVHPNFLHDDSGRNPHHSDSEDWWLLLETSDEDTIRKPNHSLQSLTYIIIITSVLYLQQGRVA